VAIPPPVAPARLSTVDDKPHYLTYIDPRPVKGVTVFARMVADLGSDGWTYRSW
jgi:hypothetical protein